MIERTAISVILSVLYALAVSAAMVGWYATGEAGLFYPGVALVIAITAVLGYVSPIAGFVGPVGAAVVWAIVVASDEDPANDGIGYVAIAFCLVCLAAAAAVGAGARLLRWLGTRDSAR